MNLLLLFVGGGAGTLSRYGIGKLSSKIYSGTFPLGTLLANIIACILLGIILIVLKDKMHQQQLNLLLITGFCGGFSTFSTFSYETIQLFNHQNYFMAFLNIAISILSCFAILYLITKIKPI